MGRRHQIFAIAKVRSYGSTDPRYQCIAAYHHEWSWEDLPLLALRRCILLLRHPPNAEIIRAELRIIEGKYSRNELETHAATVTPRVPCPFIAFILAISWTTELEDGLYASGNTFHDGLLHAGAISTETERGNDEGITVVDITDPERPAYCFVRECHTILSAADYFWYPGSPYEGHHGSRLRLPTCVSDLSDVGLVTMDALAEAWPMDFAEDLYEADSQRSSQTSLILATKHTPLVSSLGELCVEPSLLWAIQCSQILMDDFVETFMLLGKDSQLFPALRRLSPFLDGAVFILQRLIKKSKTPTKSLDLSGFCVTDDQVIRIVSACDELQSLNLSFNPNITVVTIREVNVFVPGLRRLVVMGCSSIDTTQLHRLMRTEPYLFYNLEALIHPSLMPAPDNPLEIFPISFSVITFRDNRCRFEGCSLPFFTPSSVVQSFKSLADILLRSIWSHWSIGMVAQAAFSSMTRQPEERWNERAVIAHTVLSLDVLRVTQPGWALILESRGSAMQADATVSWTFMRVRRPFEFLCTSVLNSDSPGDPKASQHRTRSPIEFEKVKALPDDAYELYDLDGFLLTTVNEGRPSACADDVEELRAILYGSSRARRRFPLMKLEDIQRLQTRLFRLDYRDAAFAIARRRRNVHGAGNERRVNL